MVIVARFTRLGALSLLTALVALALVPVRAASAQCLGSWVYGNDQGECSTDFYIDATVRWDPDGPGPEPELLVIGGNFNDAGNVVGASRIVAWDGVNWRPLGQGFNSTVFALTVLDGGLIADGSFSSSGGSPVANVARWDGTAWRAMGTGLNNEVYDLTVFNGAARRRRLLHQRRGGQHAARRTLERRRVAAHGRGLQRAGQLADHPQR
jgi:hypothetical protein